MDKIITVQFGAKTLQNVDADYQHFKAILHKLHKLHTWKEKSVHIRILILIYFINIYIIYLQNCNMCSLAVFDSVRPLFYYIHFAQIAQPCHPN